MRNALLPLLLLLGTATGATAQTDCAKPVVQLLRYNAVLPATPSALPAAATLRVATAAGCPAQRYRFRHAEVTLVRNGRPVLPILLVENSQLDLRPFASYYRTGDQLRVFIAYQNLAALEADGSLLPLVAAKDAKLRPGQIDLQTAESKGISLVWPLVKP